MFGTNEVFYGYAFNAPRYSAGSLKTHVHQDGLFITEVFKNRFGPPTECWDLPTVLQFKQGFDTYYCEWGHPELEVYTGFTEYELEYYAIGYVASRAMKKALKAQEAEESASSAKEAAGQF